MQRREEDKLPAGLDRRRDQPLHGEIPIDHIHEDVEFVQHTEWDLDQLPQRHEKAHHGEGPATTESHV